MSKKDYEAIAKILAVPPKGGNEEYRKALVRMLSDYFAGENKNFDQAKFLNAADVYNPYLVER